MTNVTGLLFLVSKSNKSKILLLSHPKIEQKMLKINPAFFKHFCVSTEHFYYQSSRCKSCFFLVNTRLKRITAEVISPTTAATKATNNNVFII
jgi:hypothetical protein